MKVKIYWPKNNKIKYLIGIDEAGRGPLAGPVAVATVCVKKPLGRSWLAGLKDSKGLSEARREKWFAKIRLAQTAGELNFAVSLVSAPMIDRLGIVKAIKLATKRSLNKLFLPPRSCRVLLDGALSCDPAYLDQTTIIKGDQTEPLIALASIVAKVTRDRLMCCLAKVYPEYELEIHKGYGTARHRRHLKRHGPSLIHRRSFISNLI